MAGRPGGQPPHHDNLIDFDEPQPQYYSGARPPVNDENLLERFDIDSSDTAPPGRPSVSYDEFVGGRANTSALPGGPGAPAGQTPYLQEGSRAYSQTSDLNNYQRYSDADIPIDDDGRST